MICVNKSAFLSLIVLSSVWMNSREQFWLFLLLFADDLKYQVNQLADENNKNTEILDFYLFQTTFFLEI